MNSIKELSHIAELTIGAVERSTGVRWKKTGLKPIAVVSRYSTASWSLVPGQDERAGARAGEEFVAGTRLR
ncbi:hypothetical protein KGM_214923 [Danaus plexippus plexippus]|uniref:Uncharacterized protein n=1 Tax=Danaus plexippus plexippus TaxID=278856 RepID=A0A212EUD3_DANPL|nr:hypothetical protein KGM_214923 [Danaus plexippus plexippus]